MKPQMKMSLSKITMMFATTLGLGLGVSLFSPTASAIEYMGRQPAAQHVYTAQLAPVSRNPSLPQSIVLTQIVNGATTRFILTVNSVPYNFQVMNVQTDACQSVQYTAHNQDIHGNVMDLVLIDNQHRTCQDFAAIPAWIAHLQVPTPDQPTTIDFTGTPVASIVVQNLLHTLDVHTDLNPMDFNVR